MIKKLFIILIAITCKTGFGQITTSINPTISQMQSLLQGNGIVVTGLTITCPSGAFATFNNGSSALGGSLNSGILLTTGTASDVASPNTSSNNLSYDAGAPGSMLGDNLSGGTTFDGCYISFLITPNCSTLSLNYAFASEEYPEYSVGAINDVFGFVITGPNPAGGTYNETNIAVLPGTSTPVSIQSVNNGTANVGPCVNCAYYVANPPGLTYDAVTTVLTASAQVTPCQQYTMTIGVWDDSDGVYDSGVFLDLNGVSCGGATNVVNTAISTNTLCTAQTITLTANSGIPNAVYNWTSSANGNLVSTTGQTVSANPVSSSTYTLNYHDSTLCAGVDVTQTFTVDFVSSPNFSVTSSNSGTLCSGQSATLTANAGTGNYTWTPNSSLNVDNTQSVISTPTTSTTYTINFEDGNGCTNLTSITIPVSICTGINTVNDFEKSVLLYPNPVNSKLYFITDLNVLNVKVFNYNGQLLSLPVSANSINCSNLNNGIYTIEFKTEKGIVYKKFVKID